MTSKTTKGKKSKNTKRREIKCLRCGKPTTIKRNYEYYCSELCQVQEGIDRKETGKTIKAFTGSHKQLMEFLCKKAMLYELYQILYKKYYFTINQINNKEHKESYKISYPTFSLYYNPLNKKKTFSLFITDSISKCINHHKPIQLKFTNKNNNEIKI
jgi:hypothetical protein